MFSCVVLSSIGDCDVIVIVQEEYPVVLCWALWAIVMAVVQLVLCFVSSFTVLRYPYDCSPMIIIHHQCVFLRYIPARLCLHIVSCLLALWAGFVMVQVLKAQI